MCGARELLTRSCRAIHLSWGQWETGSDDRRESHASGLRDAEKRWLALGAGDAAPVGHCSW